jgi:hypothetical protein
MAKRYFDSGKFDDPFYRKLSPELKCTYDYLQSKCDYAGILDIDVDDINFKVGCKNITYELIKETFKEKFIILDEKEDKLKIFMPRFIWWQYKNELMASNKVHRHVHELLKLEGISTEQFLAPKVLTEDFEYWDELAKQLKNMGITYKDYIKER